MNGPGQGPSPAKKHRLSAGAQVIIGLSLAMVVSLALVLADIAGVGPYGWWCQYQADQLLRPVPGVISTRAACQYHPTYISHELEVTIDADTDEETVAIGTTVLTTLAQSRVMQDWSLPRFRRTDEQPVDVLWTQIGVSPNRWVFTVAEKWGIQPR